MSFRNILDDSSPQGKKVQIKRGDGGPLKPEILKTGKPGVVAWLKEIEPGEHYELIVGLTPPMTSGRLRSWIKLKTGVEESPDATVNLYADIPQGWSAPELSFAGP